MGGIGSGPANMFLSTSARRSEPDPERWVEIGGYYYPRDSGELTESRIMFAELAVDIEAEFGRQRAAGFRFRPSDRREGALGLLPIIVWTTEAA